MENMLKSFGLDFDSLIKISAKDYNSIYIVDLETDSFIPVILNNDISKSLKNVANKNMTYHELMVTFAESLVVPEDKEKYLSYAETEGMRRELKKTEKYTFTFHRYGVESKIELIEMTVIKIGEDNSKAIALYKNIDVKNINIQKERNEELKVEIQKQRFVDEVVHALSSMYYTVYKIDIVNDVFEEIKTIPQIAQFINRFSSARECLKGMVRVLIKENYRRELYELVDVSKWQEKLARKNNISEEYEGTFTGWCRMSIVVSSRDASGHVTDVLLCVQDINEEKKAELKNKAELTRSLELQKKVTGELESALSREQNQDNLIKALSIGFENVYSVNIVTEQVACFRMGKFINSKYGEAFYSGNYGTNLKIYVENEVYEEDRNLFAPILDIEGVKKIFAVEQSYTINYRVLRKGEMHYFQCQLSKPDEIEDEFALGFKNIDNEMIEELKQKEVLRSALAAAEHANKSKTRFLSNMSHDIRTPLNAIMGYTMLAKNHIEDSELLESYLNKIATSSNHLLSLINEVLDMSKIESGKNFIDLKEEKLSSIIEELKAIAMVNVMAKNLDFVVDTSEIGDEVLLIDKLKFSQVLINILSNAIKYTSPGGKIFFKIERKESSWDELCSYEFTVKDNGIGMSKAFLEKIFEPFEREYNSTVSGIQGTGLGMSITKNIIDMMGGTIEVESAKNKGTTVVVRLQFKRASIEHKENQEKKRIFKGRRILIAEDNDLNREIDVDLLSEEGFVVDTASNGLEAYETIARSAPGKYEIILMDIQMPIMNGYDATKKIRQISDPLLAGIPILALTADAFEENRDAAIKAGMNGYITKPIEMPKLLNKISEFLRK